jgi:hypothetical protein
MDRAFEFGVVIAFVAICLLVWAVIATIMLASMRSRLSGATSESERLLMDERSKAADLRERIDASEKAARDAVARLRSAESARDEARAQLQEEQQAFTARLHKAGVQIDDLARKVRQLSVWQQHVDAAAALKAMQDEVIRIGQIASSDARILITNAEHRASALLESARLSAAEIETRSSAILRDAETRAEEVVAERVAEIDPELDEARAMGRDARAQAAKIIVAAEAGAKDIAGEAWDVRNRVRDLREAEAAIRNTIDGYGTRYLVPSYSLMDDAAAELVGTDPPTKFRNARQRSKDMVESGEAIDVPDSADERIRTGGRFLLDAFNGKADSIVNAARREDFGTLRQRMLDAFGLVNMHGESMQSGRISRQYMDSRLEEVRWACVLQEARLQSKEEQRQMRERMREEALANRERERMEREAAEAERRKQELETQLQAQRNAFEAEKTTLTDEARERYLSKVAEMQAELDEARQAAIRKQSLAQQTRAGHVYIIANVGAFGEGVFKIGMTRRGDDHWRDRIDELSDASVPFDFNIYAVIKSDDAPALERRLHWHFAMWQVNKKNHRKEFFRVPLDKLRGDLVRLGIDAEWSLESELEPLEYLESREIERRLETDASERAAWLRQQKQRFGALAAEQPAWAAAIASDPSVMDVDR